MDHLQPVLLGHVLQGVADLPADAPGVVDQDVGAAEPGEEVPDRPGVGEVDIVLVDAVHGRPVAAERLGDGGPDAVRRAGDDRGLAGQWPGHRIHPSSSSARTSATPAAQTACMSSSGRA